MKLKEMLPLIRETTRLKLVDNKGNALTANLHKRDITKEFDDYEVENLCVRYQGNGHTVRFYLQITIKA